MYSSGNFSEPLRGIGLLRGLLQADNIPVLDFALEYLRFRPYERLVALDPILHAPIILVRGLTDRQKFTELENAIVYCA